MATVKWFLAALMASLALGAQAAPGDPVKVVYHMNEGVEHAPQMLRNIRNHLTADPKAKIVVVAHAAGVDFLLRDAKDKNGNPFEVTVQDLVSKGVEFRACAYTLKVRNIDPKNVIEDAKLVPSGVAEVARLQAQEGYVYLKP
ncbi:MAG TPA: DsrE family protein [Usitatibacter sp.]|nr:DsrE family protein [Usitatibacter sp.]